MILAASIYWKSWGIFHFGELFQVDDSFSFDVLSSFTMGIGYCIAEFQDLIVFGFTVKGIYWEQKIDSIFYSFSW